jgi:hypothetical protein
MTIASDLLQRHIETLVDDNAQWQTLIADDILWELAYAPSIGHPAQLSGREEAVRHAIWFVAAVQLPSAFFRGVIWDDESRQFGAARKAQRCLLGYYIGACHRMYRRRDHGSVATPTVYRGYQTPGLPCIFHDNPRCLVRACGCGAACPQICSPQRMGLCRLDLQLHGSRRVAFGSRRSCSHARRPRRFRLSRGYFLGNAPTNSSSRAELNGEKSDSGAARYGGPPLSQSLIERIGGQPQIVL